MNYVRIQEGQIIEGPGPLPKVWDRINGFHHLSDEELRSHGWFPFEPGPEDPEVDPRVEKVVRRVKLGLTVTHTVEVEPLSEPEIAENLEEVRQQKLARNAELRWQREVGGIEFYGIPPREVPIPIQTDRDSRHAIFMAAVRGWDQHWKCADNEWHHFSGEEMAVLSEAIADHVRIAFDLEEMFAVVIRAAENFAALDQIDLEAMWKSG
jgi:hypothetical protein